MPDPLLRVDDVELSFGGVRALSGAMLRVDPGQVVGLIGPNGAGKTSLFNVVSGLFQPNRGRVVFEGSELVGRAPHEVASLGIVRTFQNLAIFDSCTVLENVMIGASAEVGLPMFGSVCRPWRVRRQEAERRARALEALAACEIDDLANERPDTLPYGSLKRVELARAVMARPKLLMLDELAAGLSPTEVGQLKELVRGLQTTFGFALLLVEHHMDFVMSLSSTVTVLDAGRTLATGTPKEIKANESVVAAYLGGSV